MRLRRLFLLLFTWLKYLFYQIVCVWFHESSANICSHERVKLIQKIVEVYWSASWLVATGFDIPEKLRESLSYFSNITPSSPSKRFLATYRNTKENRILELNYMCYSWQSLIFTLNGVNRLSVIHISRLCKVQRLRKGMYFLAVDSDHEKLR